MTPTAMPSRRKIRDASPALLLATLLPLTGCQALGTFAATRMSPLQWNGQTRIELPLTLNAAGSPMVAIQVMGRDVVALIDTGASIPAISRSLATDTGVDIEGTLNSVNGQKRPSAEDVQMRIGPLSATALLAIVHDDEDPPFVLGMNLFLQAVVEMDFEAGRLTLIRPDAFEPPPGQPLSVKLMHAVPTIALQVNGHEEQICAIVDTGFNAGLALMPKVLEKLALPPHPAGGTITARGAFGVRHEAPALAPLDNLQVGGLVYRAVPVGYAPPWAEDECNNLLGMDVLYRHRLVFDFPNRRFWLLPRAGNQW
jgi:predicted aspartyl protease